METSEHYPLEINYIGDPRLTSLLYLIATCVVKLLRLGRTLSTVQISLLVLCDFQHQIHSNIWGLFIALDNIINRLNTPFPSFCEIHSFLCCMGCLEVMMLDDSLSCRSGAFFPLLLDGSIFYWITIGSKSETLLDGRLDWQLPSLTPLYTLVLRICRQNRRQYRSWKSATIGLGPVLYWWVFTVKNDYGDLSRGTWSHGHLQHTGSCKNKVFLWDKSEEMCEIGKKRTAIETAPSQWASFLCL